MLFHKLGEGFVAHRQLAFERGQFIPKAPHDWIFEDQNVGEASHVPRKDLQPQAGRLRYIAKVEKETDFGITLALPNTSGREPTALKGGGSLFEKGFLPLVKERWRDAVLAAEVADGCALGKVLAQDVHFLFGAVVAAGCLRVGLHTGAHSVADPSGFSISSEAGNNQQGLNVRLL
jgi:hypothetical protein